MLTVSTRASRRQAEDTSGPLLARLAEEAGADVQAMEVVPDDFALIEDRLHHFVDDDMALVFTTGGTGFTPDDVTPEATRAVIERLAPGFSEASLRPLITSDSILRGASVVMWAATSSQSP